MEKLISKFNQLKSIVKEAVKKQPLVDQENSIDTNRLTKNEINFVIRIDEIEAEKDLWKNQYLSLIKNLKEKEKVDKLIKSRL